MSSARYAVRFSEPLRKVALRYAGPAPVSGELAETRAREAYERGVNEAREFHNQQLLTQREEMLDHQRHVLEVIDRQVQTFVEQVRQRLPDLLFALVGRVLEGVRLEGGEVASLVESVLAEYAHHEGEVLEITLSPGDLERLEAYRREAGQPAPPHLTFRAEAKLRSGDCEVRSRFGLLDARLETRLNKIRETLSAS